MCKHVDMKISLFDTKNEYNSVLEILAFSLSRRKTMEVHNILKLEV